MRQTTDLRRKQIGQVVLDILINDGPIGVTTAAVAEKIGVVPSALYRHYGSLEAMLEAGLTELKERLEQRMINLTKNEPDPLERLHLVLSSSRDIMPIIVVMPKLLFGNVAISGSMVRYIDCLQDEMLGKWELLFKTGQDSGQVRKDVCAYTLALIYWGMLTHSFLRWTVTEGAFNVEEHLETCWRLLHETISVDGAKSDSVATVIPVDNRHEMWAKGNEGIEDEKAD